MEILIATANSGKLVEFAQMLGELPLELRDLAHYGIGESVDEIGETFSENAALKASTYARLAGIPALADDSGLVIDYLHGAPSVRSARFAGEGASDNDRIEKVLLKMRSAPDDERKARFVCSVALSDRDGNIVAITEATCEGFIATSAKGSNGFGYDPVFVPDGFDQTFAELPAEIKNNISHRRKAVAKIIPSLQGFFKI